MLPLAPRSLHESRLRSLSLFGLSFAGLPVLPQRFVPLTTSSLRGSRSLFELAAFLPCSLVTAPRVPFVVPLLMPTVSDFHEKVCQNLIEIHFAIGRGPGFFLVEV